MAMEGEPRNFEDSLFRIYPPLGYRVRSEYRIAKRSEEEKRKARATKRPLTPTVDGDAAFETEDKKVMKEERTALQILNDRLRMETDKNVQTVEEIHRAGAQNDVVKYGSHVQLLHVQSGKWLSCHEDAAHMDRDCRRVSLKYGSFLDRKIQNPLDPEDESVSLFHFMPRFKAQSVGSTIYFTHNLKLGSTKSEGLWVHADTNPDFSLSQLCHPMDPTLDQCLRTVSVYEANCSPKELTMKIERYASASEPSPDPQPVVARRQVSAPRRCGRSALDTGTIPPFPLPERELSPGVLQSGERSTAWEKHSRGGSKRRISLVDVSCAAHSLSQTARRPRQR